MTCQHCQFSAVKLNGGAGSQQAGGFICRASPPIPAAIPVNTPQGMAVQILTMWPVVEKTDICGMFEPQNTSKTLKLSS